MKKTLLLLLLVLPLTVSCAALAAAQAEDEREGAELAQAALATGDLEIEVRDIIPQLGQVIHSNGEYFLRIKDGKATSYLPFFGTSTFVNYGSTDGGIKFTDQVVDIYALKSRTAKGETKWGFIARSDAGDDVEFIITFWDNGSAGIACNSRRRSRMTYNGRLKPLPTEE